MFKGAPPIFGEKVKFCRGTNLVQDLVWHVEHGSHLLLGEPTAAPLGSVESTAEDIVTSWMVHREESSTMVQSRSHLEDFWGPELDLLRFGLRLSCNNVACNGVHVTQNAARDKYLSCGISRQTSTPQKAVVNSIRESSNGSVPGPGFS
jgi:hypothetical protein